MNKIITTLSQNAFRKIQVEGNDYMLLFYRMAMDNATGSKYMQLIMVIRPGVDKKTLEYNVPRTKVALGTYVKNHMQNMPYEVLTIFLESDYSKVASICQNDPHAWIVDSNTHRLILFDNQAADCFGLRKPFEMMSMTGIGSSTPIDIKTKLDSINYKNIPWCTTVIIIINILIFLIMEVLGDTTNANYLFSWGGMLPSAVIDKHQYWRLFTAMFIHAGAAHLLNNMFSLFIYGQVVEKYTGKIKFLIIYLVSGLMGSVLSTLVMLHTGNLAVGIGASGAIFGICGAMFSIIIINGGYYNGINARRMIFYLALMLYSGVTQQGVDNWAHLGGALAGIITTFIIVRKRQQIRD